MKLSLNWIKDFIELPEKLEVSKLAYDLTMSTVEVEEAIDLSSELAGMVVGHVRRVRPHPDADKLVVCDVALSDTNDVALSDTGNTGSGTPELHQIVCGGINVAEGMKVAVAPPGTKVRWHGEGDPVELKKAKIRGVESYGMICSSSEIGLFDLFPYTEEATIMDISEFEAPPGTPLSKALGLDDTVLVIDNKSLTNRPDLWGHYGVARELSAIYDLPLKEFPAPPSLIPNPCSPFPIKIEDPDLCPRYIGVKIEGVPIKPAPFEIRSRLWRVGIRPINAIVDITNYVMLETGNPTHAFDADNVHGGIIVRRAKPGEKLLLLSGADLTLTADDLVIADEKEAIALAGVMGGEKDSVLPETSRVILEIANFNALTVRRTSMRYDVRTEAATRYEKGIDPQRADLALSSAMRLFKEIYPNLNIAGLGDSYPRPLESKEIQVSLSWLEKRLGKWLSNDYLTGLFERLGFKPVFGCGDDSDSNGGNSKNSSNGGGSSNIMRVKVPSWRSTGDVSLPDDIMEEIARIHGLENFEPAPIVTAFDGAINQVQIDLDRKIRQYLAHSAGMNEVFTYPWVSREYITAALGGTGGMLELSSPPSPEERYLRSSLVPGLCKAVSENLRYFDEFALFESAQVFFDKGYSSPYDERESLPLQRKHVAGAFVAPRERYAEVFRRAKGTLEAMPRQVHIPPLGFEDAGSKGVEFECTEKPPWADDTVWLSIAGQGKKIGSMGLLSQKTALACGIKNAAVMLFELDIDELKPLPSRENAYRPAPAFPVTEYDISLLFDAQAKWEDIKEAAAGKEHPDNLLHDVSYVEQYTGSQIPDGKKSVTIRLLIGSHKKTLTSDEIESCAGAVTKRLCKTLGAEPR